LQQASQVAKRLPREHGRRCFVHRSMVGCNCF
jgi:hypothetical protein